MCGCATAPGSSATNPLRIGDAGGGVHHVHVDIALGGLWQGEAWVTGQGVQAWLDKGFIREW